MAIAHKNKKKMQTLLFSMGRMPGFHGIRVTAFKFAQNYARTYDRIMNDKDDKTETWDDRAKEKNKNIPMRIGYTRAKPDTWIDISIVIKRMKKGLRPIPKERKSA